MGPLLDRSSQSVAGVFGKVVIGLGLAQFRANVSLSSVARGAQEMDDPRKMDDTRQMEVATRVMKPLPAGEGARQQDSRLHVVLVHDRPTVEELLDWLERTGRPTREVLVVGDDFIVRWQE